MTTVVAVLQADPQSSTDYSCQNVHVQWMSPSSTRTSGSLFGFIIDISMILEVLSKDIYECLQTFTILHFSEKLNFCNVGWQH